MREDEKARQDEAKKQKDDETKRQKEAHIDRYSKEERDWLINLFVMIRDQKDSKDPMSSDVSDIFARYRGEQEKLKHGISWPKGDDDASRLLGRYFRPESIFRRL